MNKHIFIKIVLASVVSIIFVFLLSNTIFLHKDLKDWKIDFSVSKNGEGDIKLTASVLMEGKVWRYFRGSPVIEVHGVDFSSFFANGGIIFFENKSQYKTEYIEIKERAVKSLKYNLCDNHSAFSTYRLSPSVVSYKDVGAQKFVDVHKSRVINYQRGLNEITIVLKHFSGNDDISGELIFNALDNKMLLIYPMAGTIFTGIALLFIAISLLKCCINKEIFFNGGKR